MGDLRFKFSSDRRLDDRVWSNAFITGIEGIPWQCHHRLDGDQFSIWRRIDESGKLNIVWPTSALGNVCLSTTSLRTDAEPYDLILELARGTTARLQNQVFEWQRIGLRLPENFFPLAEKSLSLLIESLTGQTADRYRVAQASIEASLEASLMLCHTFGAQALESRKQSEGRLSTLLGLQLPASLEAARQAEVLDQSFNLMCVSADYGAVETAAGSVDFAQFDRQVEWCVERGKKVCVGPLLNFAKGGMPKWMSLLGQDFDGIRKTACDHVLSVVQRYKGKVHLWNCAAGLNVPGDFGWSDEETLHMAVSLIETIRRADDRCPVLLTIDQPWSEYLRHEADGISPLHFADALIRADLGLSGLALDIRMDVYPDGTFPRDPIEVNRMIDRWALLGLPLMIVLSTPQSSGQGGQTKKSEDIGSVNQWNGGPPEHGLLQPELLVRMLLSKPAVHAVIWNESVCTFGQSRSLWHSNSSPTKLLQDLQKLRQNYLH